MTTSPALLAKTALLEQNNELLSLFRLKGDIKQLVALRCQFVDCLLQQQWREQALDSYPIALIAVGGYGRAELHPQSDIDLLFLIDTQLTPCEEKALSGYIAFYGTPVLKSAIVFAVSKKH